MPPCPAQTAPKMQQGLVRSVFSSRWGCAGSQAVSRRSTRLSVPRPVAPVLPAAPRRGKAAARQEGQRK